jgi:hypothetical protein
MKRDLFQVLARSDLDHEPEDGPVSSKLFAWASRIDYPDLQ